MGYDFSKLHPQAKEAVAVVEVLARLGFNRESIGIAVTGKGEGVVVLHEDGDPIFSMGVGPLIGATPELFCGQWKEGVLALHERAATNEGVRGLLEKSTVFYRVDEIMQALIKKGYEFRPLADAERVIN